MIKEKILKDIEYNISELRDRIDETQNFQIQITIYDLKDDCLDSKQVSIRDFIKEQNFLLEQGLYSVVSNNFMSFMLNYQQSLQEYNNSMDKLMLEIDKINLTFENSFNEKENKKDKKLIIVPEKIEDVKIIAKTERGMNVSSNSIRKFSEVYTNNEVNVTEDESSDELLQEEIEEKEINEEALDLDLDEDEEDLTEDETKFLKGER